MRVPVSSASTVAWASLTSGLPGGSFFHPDGNVLRAAVAARDASPTTTSFTFQLGSVPRGPMPYTVHTNAMTDIHPKNPAAATRKPMRAPRSVASTR